MGRGDRELAYVVLVDDDDLPRNSAPFYISRLASMLDVGML
jgi:hypothetical protein